MKKVLIVFVMTVAAFTGANAQKGFTFGAGLRLGLPVGDFADGWSFGLGGEVQGEYGFSENVSGIITSGYTHFFGKKVNGIEVDGVGLIPFLAGIRYYPSEKVFIGAQAGYGVLTGSGSSDGAFDWQPQVGINTEHFQVALNYNGFSKNGSTLGHIGLTGIFKFGSGGSAAKK